MFFYYVLLFFVDPFHSYSRFLSDIRNGAEINNAIHIFCSKMKSIQFFFISVLFFYYIIIILTEIFCNVNYKLFKTIGFLYSFFYKIIFNQPKTFE